MGLTLPTRLNVTSLHAHTRASWKSFVRLCPMRQPGTDRTDPMTTTILALDLGTTTGWALRTPDGAITSGS